METEPQVTFNNEAEPSSSWYGCFRTKTASSGQRDVTSYAYPPTVHSVFDLTNIGLLLTLPVGAFIVAGQVGRDAAGPSSALCVILAGLAAMLTGLCYADLRSRVNRSQSSAYENIYTVGGEVLAFIVGWLLFLHHILCSAAVARSISANIDSITLYRLSNFTSENVASISLLDSSLDFVALLMVVVTSLFLVANCQVFNKRPMRIAASIATTAVLCFAMAVGVYHLDFSNWKTAPKFFQGGKKGVFTGSALFLVAFSGFDHIMRATDFTSRSVRKSVIHSCVLTWVLTVLLLVGLVSSMTLLLPATQWITEAPMGESFSQGGLFWVKYIINSCSVLLMLPVELTQLHQASSILTQLAKDGLIPKILAGTSDRISSLPAALCSGILAACFAMTFNLTSSISVSALAFIVIQLICSLVILGLRYRPTEESANEAKKRRDIQRRLRKKVKRRETTADVNEAANMYGSTEGQGQSDQFVNVTILQQPSGFDHNDNATSQSMQTSTVDCDLSSLVDLAPSPPQAYANDVSLLGENESLTTTNDDSQLGSSSSDTDVDDAVEEYQFRVCTRVLTERRRDNITLRVSSSASYRRALLACIAFTACSISAAAVTIYGSHLLRGPVGIILLSVSLVFAAVCCIVVARLPVDNVECAFLLIPVPGVPYVPLLTCFILVHLAVSVSSLAWITSSIWLLLGLSLYGAYGIGHSTESIIPEHQPPEQRGLLPALFRPPRPHTTTHTYSRLVIHDI